MHVYIIFIHPNIIDSNRRMHVCMCVTAPHSPTYVSSSAVLAEALEQIWGMPPPSLVLSNGDGSKHSISIDDIYIHTFNEGKVR